MKIISLYLRNFRNIEELSIALGPEMNEIVGPNGKGKTSLIEAIFVAMTGTSFRTDRLEELVRYKQEGFFIECTFEKEGVLHKLQFSFDGKKKRIQLNDRPVASSLQLLGQILGVISTPEVQELVKGEPRQRRFFLDLLIGATQETALSQFCRFKRALKQRNAALKMKDERSIFAWEEELSHSMAYVAACRYKLVDELSPFLQEFSQALLNESLVISYERRAEPESLAEYYRSEFEKKRAQEIVMGVTLVGPHRDDLHLHRGKKRFQDFASEGELRLGALALKLAEWQVMKQRTGFPPLFMIDDFAAFLDSHKREELSRLIGSMAQVFLTAHEPQGKGTAVFRL